MVRVRGNVVSIVLLSLFGCIEGHAATWSKGALLLPPTLTCASGFGSGVAISGNTLMVGAPGVDDVRSTYVSTVYAYERQGSDWKLQGAPIVTPRGGNGDAFGASLFLDGDTALINASGYASRDGRVYTFVRSGNAWTQESDPLIGSDFACRMLNAQALSGDTAVLAGDGCAYVFERAGGTWSKTATLVEGGNLQPDTYFSAAISGDTVLLGQAHANVGPNLWQGAVFVFTRSGKTWTKQPAQIVASDGAEFDYFGAAVALQGDTAFIGAPERASVQGAFYVFARSGNGWVQRGSAITGGTNSFAEAISASASSVAVLSRWVPDRNGSGAYMYAPDGNTWTEQGTPLLPDDYAYLDSVATSDETVVLGSSGHRSSPQACPNYAWPAEGAAYIFTAQPSSPKDGGTDAASPTDAGGRDVPDGAVDAGDASGPGGSRGSGGAGGEGAAGLGGAGGATGSPDAGGATANDGGRHATPVPDAGMLDAGVHAGSADKSSCDCRAARSARHDLAGMPWLGALLFSAIRRWRLRAALRRPG